MSRAVSSCSVLLLALLAVRAAEATEIDFASAHAVVIDDATGSVLASKEPKTAAPIASLTKLLTAMVVLDAKQRLDDELRITDADVDRLKHTRSGVPVGAAVPRGALLELALVASDNRAASALARHYRQGLGGFLKAVQRKIKSLGLKTTTIEEPTGLSPNNVASAEDFAKVLRAAARYPDLARITSQPAAQAIVLGRPWEVRNTNALVGAPGWDVLLSKTGYIREAGLCLSMRLRVGARTVSLVLLGAPSATERALDVQNVSNWLTGQPLVARARAPSEHVAAPESALAAAAAESTDVAPRAEGGDGSAAAAPAPAADDEEELRW